MKKYNVYVPYRGVMIIEVEASSENEAISKARSEDYISSEIVPNDADKRWSESWTGLERELRT